MPASDFVGSILDSLRKMDWASRPLRAKGRRITEAIAELIAMMGRQPTEQEIADHVGMPLAKLQKVVAELDGLTVLGQETFAAFDPSETHDLIESAPSQSEDDPFTLCLRGETHEQLAQSIGQLSEREQLLLSLYYREELTMREVAGGHWGQAVTGLADTLHDSDQVARSVEPRTSAATGRIPDGTAAGEVVDMMDTNHAIAIEAPIMKSPLPHGETMQPMPGATPSYSNRPTMQNLPEGAAADESNLGLVLDVELKVLLRFGQRQLTLREVLDLKCGSVVELDRRVDEPVELLLDGRVIARGEAAIVDGNYGLRVTESSNLPTRCD